MLMAAQSAAASGMSFRPVDTPKPLDVSQTATLDFRFRLVTIRTSSRGESTTECQVYTGLCYTEINRIGGYRAGLGTQRARPRAPM